MQTTAYEMSISDWSSDVCSSALGCYMMHGQELATAVQYGLPIVVIVVNNGKLGTIRMHQENHFPGRVSATDLANPDFVALAPAYGPYGELVEDTADFPAAFQRPRDCGKPENGRASGRERGGQE